MDKALGVIGQHILLQIMVAMIIATTEELSIQTNATKIVGSRLRNCKF